MNENIIYWLIGGFEKMPYKFTFEMSFMFKIKLLAKSFRI